ncbi:hypothetical protein OK349_08355 [Sphingomonas sp. BT-65]|uniref:hypothetical protein n=1 Tax=Sphingomonas sp. BT-65 TaxID=2989821 RepID=UPI002235D732|nr:hypothetical protein [Sphingomonas sp. BT-65]MCW4461719.1 hypothetical protein [Sphingomonas sp. BT-65]
MDSTTESLSPAGAASMFGWVTVTHLIVVALCAVGAIAILVWGRRLRRKRLEAERTREEDAGRDQPPPA